MNSKNEKSRNMHCILIVILLYLALYCTTSGFVNLTSPTSKNVNEKDDIRIIQNNLEQAPKNMDPKTWNILKDIEKKMGFINKNNPSNLKYLISNKTKISNLPQLVGPNLEKHQNPASQTHNVKLKS